MTTTVSLSNSLSGQYMAEIIHADGTITEVPWFNNLILDSGLNDIGLDPGALTSYCVVGTGTSTPTASQTTLDAKLPGNSINTNSYPHTNTHAGAPTYASLITFRYDFGLGGVVGNITEVGVGKNSAGTGLFSRALFTDAGGNPIAITVTANDQLIVYYKLTIIPNLNDVTGTVVLAGTTHNYTARIYAVDSYMTLGGGNQFASSGTFLVYPPLCYVGDSTMVLKPVTATSLTGLTNTISSGVNAPYVTGSFYRDCVCTVSPTAGNSVGGIGGMSIVTGYVNNGAAKYQYVFSPPIPKTNVQQLSLTIRASWARA